MLMSTAFVLSSPHSRTAYRVDCFPSLKFALSGLYLRANKDEGSFFEWAAASLVTLLFFALISKFIGTKNSLVEGTWIIVGCIFHKLKATITGMTWRWILCTLLLGSRHAFPGVPWAADRLILSHADAELFPPFWNKSVPLNCYRW